MFPVRVPAALLMAVYKTILKTHAHRMYSPAQIMTIVNDEICQQNEHSMLIRTYFRRIAFGLPAG